MVMQYRANEGFEYVPYPARRYHASGETRLIHSEKEEEKGWYDSPAPATEEAKELQKAVTDKLAAEKAAWRAARDAKKASPSKSEISVMNKDQLTELAQKIGLTELPATNRGLKNAIFDKMGL